MSDSSEEKSDSKDDTHPSNVCRDFIRGMCDRKFCKYKHESDAKTLNFCHDFQNTMCPRPNCKFIHCTADEEMEYKSAGHMSNHILAEATRKNQLPGTMPICNRFREGLCRRSFCKYRHLTKDEEDAEIMELIQQNNHGNPINSNNNKRNNSSVVCINNPMIEPRIITLPQNGLHQRRTNITFEEYEECGIQLPKRRFLNPAAEQEIITNGELGDGRRAVFQGYFAGNPPPPMLSRVDARTLMLEEENNMLHKEIAQLKRQVSDLTATNEFLLDQNANFRVSNKINESVNMPAITNTNGPQVIRTVTASVATVPVSLATVSTCNPVSIAGCPTVTMASPAQILAPSQQILVTTNPSTQLAIANNLAQQAQPQLTSQTQQLALATTTQQLTLATPQPTHQQLNQAQQLANQQLGSQPQQVVLASTAQQLTSQPQQIATQHLTVASVPQQLLAQPNAQIEIHRNNQINAINTSQAIAMSNTSQPLVSYPIMTQSLNHALAH